MRISLFGLLSLTIPAAFFSLWIANLNKNGEIEWHVFSLDELQNEKKPAIILCVPEMFWTATPPLSGIVNSELLKEVDTSQFIAYRHKYRYWTLRDQAPSETKWVIDHGAGKEPTLILLSGDGKTKTLYGFIFNHDEIINFLALERFNPVRQNLLLVISALSLLATLAIIIKQQKSTSDNTAVNRSRRLGGNLKS